MASKKPKSGETSDIPHFDISAYVVRQLGEELVSDEVTALMELVKNAYDADSKYVRIIISTKGRLASESLHYPEHTGYILVEDGGDGMDANDLTKGWLTISSSKKRGMKERGETTFIHKRTPLGDKGLGRLSAQRLGHKLEIVTRKQGESEYHVGFNFDDFKEDTLLGSVPVEWEEIPSSTKKKGTKLIILDLFHSQVWKGDAGDKLIAKLLQLISPYKELRPFSISLTIDGIPVQFDDVTDKLRNEAITQYEFGFDGKKITITGKMKLSKLRGNAVKDIDNYENYLVSDKGEELFNYLKAPERKFATAYNLEKSKERDWYLTMKKQYTLDSIGDIQVIANENFHLGQQGANESINTETEVYPFIIANPGPFSGCIDEYYFDDEEGINKSYGDFSAYKTLIDNQKGVKVYRDGFGIRPFGLDGNDWLMLSKGSTTGNYYVLRPNNVVGYVIITGEKNKNLKEKTDREGFVDSPYSRNFQLLINSIVKDINGFLSNIRRTYNDFKREKAEQITKLTTLESSLNFIRDTGNNVVNLSNQYASVSKSINAGKVDSKDVKQFFNDLKSMLDTADKLSEVANVIQPKFDSIEEQMQSFTQLAGLGMTSEAFSHEIATVADRLGTQTDSLIKYLEKKNINDVKINVYLEYVNGAITAMRKQLGHLAPSLRYVKEKQELIPLKHFLYTLKEFYKSRFENEQIDFELIFNVKDYSVKTNSGKLTQIFDNLILNSEYWVKAYRQTRPNFKPKITVNVKDEGIILVHDNGLGIEPAYEELIFDPFVTLKPSGRGLGLYIVKQLLEPSSCSISLQPNKNEFDRKYIFRLNLSGILA